MSFSKILGSAVTVLFLLATTLSVSSADSPLNGTGSITKISGGTVAIGKVKYKFRSTTRVLGEDGSVMKGQTIAKLGEGTYLEFKARDDEPYPILSWVKVLGD
ncbi:MAG: hypothetical protein KTR18_14775 [Acidiferrobacterales bacterium]|nr:hypothetical protein [Acidiferrobacterales bacterium]